MERTEADAVRGGEAAWMHAGQLTTEPKAPARAELENVDPLL